MVDTSALAAILFGESDAGDYAAVLERASDPILSAATLVEATIVTLNRTGAAGVRVLDEYRTTAGIRTVAVDETQAAAAGEAFRRFGKGRGRGAGLNFGDTFAYALAVTTGRPLLFKGDDFAKTDVVPALPRT